MEQKTLTLNTDRKQWSDAEVEAVLRDAHARLKKTNAAGGVDLTPIEKNALATIRFVRRPISEEEVAIAMSVKTGYDEDANVLRPVLRNLKKHGFVIDLPVAPGKLLWLQIQGDMRNDTSNFWQYRRNKIYRE